MCGGRQAYQLLVDLIHELMFGAKRHNAELPVGLLLQEQLCLDLLPEGKLAYGHTFLWLL